MGFLAELSSRRFIYASPSDDCEKVRGEGESINIVILGEGIIFLLRHSLHLFHAVSHLKFHCLVLNDILKHLKLELRVFKSVVLLLW